MNKIDIINETADYYSADPYRRRAVSGFGCSYLTPDGRKCAIGRCCINPGRLPNNSSVIGIASQVEESLYPQYRGHETIFWSELQRFHDAHRNWDDSGLTTTGEAYLKYLRRRYANH